MLNTSSKLTATFAASCSLISYSATAVVSAASCTSYAAYEFGAFPEIPVTIAIMLAFAVLVLLGVKDSANVAAAIFVVHLITLFILVTCSFVSMGLDGGAVLSANWRAPLPISPSGGVGMDLYLGYSVSLLGLTGFETSANYIEEAGPFETERNKAGPTRKVSKRPLTHPIASYPPADTPTRHAHRCAEAGVGVREDDRPHVDPRRRHQRARSHRHAGRGGSAHDPEQRHRHLVRRGRAQQRGRPVAEAPRGRRCHL